MDDVPFLFVNAVFHCLNSESLSAPRLLAHPLWSSVAEEHHQKRKDYAFWLCNPGTDKYHVFVVKPDERQYLTPEEWSRRNKTYLRVRKIFITSMDRINAPFITLKEALQYSLGMVPYLNNVDKVTTFYFERDANNVFDFLWKRPCHTFYCKCYQMYAYSSVLKWHFENNDSLKYVRTPLLYYNDVRDLIPLGAEKRLTWKMRFAINPNSFPYLRTWHAHWEEEYPLVTDVYESAEPNRGSVLYEDEHIRKELEWTASASSFLTITWK
uniref:Glycosyltransferase family 15 protein n=1 Tax=Steinernema glaseri TaxID=37863 RepID=A0A1I7Z0R3_9BILA